MPREIDVPHWAVTSVAIMRQVYDLPPYVTDRMVFARYQDACALPADEMARRMSALKREAAPRNYWLPRIFFLSYLLTIPLANWLIQHVGTTCLPGGPCLIPVWPGVYAPSGLAVAALALVFRDLVQLTLGLRFSLGAVVIGSFLSLWVAPGSLAMASAAAFLFSELVDTGVYTPLVKRGLVLAVLASGLVGIIVDSALFLFLAFGDLQFFWGQVIGKGWAVLAAVVLIRLARNSFVR